MWYLYGLALLAGVANAIEPGQNATLAKATGQPMLAGIFCFVLAIVCLFGVMVVVRLRSQSTSEQATPVPWWAWPGGILGAAVVLAQLYVSEQIGAAPFLGCVITAGVVGSIALDHYGLVGFERHPVGRWRIAGGVLMLVGVALVAAF
ncbi:transporter family-2 protein [Methylobacterium phyllostachyos]|uniref:Transporter family-2 protein n=1 Tax=Methylobacterium phyllostachyos TaxID=582672 RepID=A0A1H0CB33_9HYPH|nr:DMT family transporter [Methylobacterium phyllostachyos]SDN55089.1 transporter family-2 protein [Methylobacterium phyllostachyos]